MLIPARSCTDSCDSTLAHHTIARSAVQQYHSLCSPVLYSRTWQSLGQDEPLAALVLSKSTSTQWHRQPTAACVARYRPLAHQVARVASHLRVTLQRWDYAQSSARDSLNKLEQKHLVPALQLHLK